jgi:hypothetical protein
MQHQEVSANFVTGKAGFGIICDILQSAGNGRRPNADSALKIVNGLSGQILRSGNISVNL